MKVWSSGILPHVLAAQIDATAWRRDMSTRLSDTEWAWQWQYVLRSNMSLYTGHLDVLWGWYYLQSPDIRNWFVTQVNNRQTTSLCTCLSVHIKGSPVKVASCVPSIPQGDTDISGQCQWPFIMACHYDVTAVMWLRLWPFAAARHNFSRRSNSFLPLEMAQRPTYLMNSQSRLEYKKGSSWNRHCPLSCVPGRGRWERDALVVCSYCYCSRNGRNAHLIGLDRKPSEEAS